MEFKRSNSSRGPLSSARGSRTAKTLGGNTPLRSTTPLKKASVRGSPQSAATAGGGITPPLPPRANGTVSPHGTPTSASDLASASMTSNTFQRTTSNASNRSPQKPSKNAFERSSSNTGSKSSGFKRSNTAAGIKKAEVMKHTNRVGVYVRVRAFREDESSGELSQLAVNMDNDAVEVNVPKKGRFTFGFDGCFWSSDRACPSGKATSSQEEVFEEVGRPLVENALAGYNAAVMAYGQTGSGKTYTSFGPPGSIGTAQEGLIPRVCNMIFARAANSAQKGVTYTVSASMLEVYLEDVYDLLNHRKQLSVRNDFTNNTFNVVGQKTVLVKSYMDVLAVLNKAEPLRTFAATNIHDHSSRAHTLFLLEVQTHFDAPDLAPRCAKIMLADLAGCERIKLAGTEEGLGFEQARNINLSLLALGSCIEAVATRGRNSSRPIPEFRNSTLTKLLKDYIGGNSISTMMVTISPSERDANLSVQTLRFADRAKQITTHAKVNTVDPEQAKQDGSELSDRWRDEYLRKKEALYAEYQLKGTIDKLVNRMEDLEAKLRESADDELAIHLTAEIEEVQKALKEADYQMSLQRQILYGEFLMLEDELRELNTKMQEMKEEHEEAMEGLLGEEAGRFEEMKRGYEARLRTLQEEGEAARGAADDEIAALKRLVAELRERLAATEAECADLQEQLAALQRDVGEREEQLAAVEAHLEATEEQVSELTQQMAAAAHAAEVREQELLSEVEALQGTVAALHEDMASTEAAHADSSAKQESVQAATEELLRETQDSLHATSAKLCETAEELKATHATLDVTQDTLATTNASLETTKAKLENTEENLAETQAKLESAQATLSAEIEDLNRQLLTAETLGQQQGVYIDQLIAYTRASYGTTLAGLTELQVTAMAEMLLMSDAIVAAVTDAARAEVEKMKEMCSLVDGNYKETAARFDMLRRILGKIDQDVKEAVVEVDSKDSRRNASLTPSPRRLGDVSNRENSLDRKSRTGAHGSSMSL